MSELVAESTARNAIWILPRPRKNRYKGGFPLHFENKLIRLLGSPPPNAVLHPFGGRAEYGLRVDLLQAAQPNVVADAHNLPFADGTFVAVIVDPPYSNEESERLYGTGKLKPSRYVAEAVRVCKQDGYVVLYHKRWLPRPKGTTFVYRVFVGVRIGHQPRVVGIFQKDKLGVNRGS